MKNNSNGFTLLEVLLAFSIFLVIASLLPQMVKAISFTPKQMQGYETSLFIQQLSLDLQDTNKFAVINNVLYLYKEDELITYGFFQQRIRRRVNNTGQEIVLQKVSEITFSEWKNGIDIEIKDIYNQTHRHRVTHLLPVQLVYNE